MKKYMRKFWVASVVGVLFLMTADKQSAHAQDITVSYQMFYDNLAPYGQWVYDAEYGNVWVPNEDGDFRPYGSRGHWLMTEYGNTWVSEDPWGWAVYHYGRWTYNPYYGWVWIPGYEWAPAWVSWRFGGGYAGWAPLGPGINVGMNYYAPDSWWIFVGPQYMYQPNCIRYWYGPSYNANYIYHTTIINNYYMDNSTRVQYNYGPRAEVIQQVTRQPVRVYRVSNLNRPGAPSVGRNTIGLYRPTINRASFNNSRPERVVNAPRPIGRSQQPAPVNNRPAFRQDLQRLQPEGRSSYSQNNYNGRSESYGQQQRGRFDNNANNGRNDTRSPYTQPDRDNNPSGRYDNRNDANPSGRYDRRNDNNPSGRYDNRNDANPSGRYDGRNDNNPSGRYDNRNDANPSGRSDTRPSYSPPNRNDNNNAPSRFNNRNEGSGWGRDNVPNETRPNAPQPNRYEDHNQTNRQNTPPSVGESRFNARQRASQPERNTGGSSFSKPSMRPNSAPPPPAPPQRQPDGPQQGQGRGSGRR